MSKIANSIGSIVLGGIGAFSLPACGDRAPEHERQAFEDRTLPAFRNVAEVGWKLEHDIGPYPSRDDMLKNSTFSRRSQNNS